MEGDVTCIICKSTITDEDPVWAGEKGLRSIIVACDYHNNQELKSFIRNKLGSATEDESRKLPVHQKCRKTFTDLRKKQLVEPPKKRTRTSMQPFEWKSDCFFCGTSGVSEKKYKDKKMSNVETIEMKVNVKKRCEDIFNMETIDCEGSHSIDPKEVHHRVLNTIDLVQVEARYHPCCMRSFLHGYDMHTSGKSADAKKLGRPENDKQSQAFEKVCDWLETELEPRSIQKIHSKMAEMADGDDVYTVKRMKQKLVERYNESISFSKQGREKIVCLDNAIKAIINNAWYEHRNRDPEEEKFRIVKLAAKIISAEIKALNVNKDAYPSENSIADLEEGKRFMPETLQAFLRTIIKSPLKQNSIGQCMVYANRPMSSLPPVVFGVGVETAHVMGSRWLVDQLARLGFSISYEEVTRYKQSILQTEQVENIIPENQFTQWSADNADHNLSTIDGKNTFHGMGVIASTITPTSSNAAVATLPSVQRRTRIPVKDLITEKGIKLYRYDGGPVSCGILLKPIRQLLRPYILPKALSSDLLWQCGWLLHPKANVHPSNWSGFMQKITDSPDSFEKSEIYLLPLIDLDPSDSTCIYSTLRYIEQQARNLNVVTPCVTFDQPLWLKAVSIIKAKDMKIVCRLGGFHMLMSFLGSIGALMQGSGLEAVLAEVYAPNVIPHILSGKAFSRSLRGHFLVYAALTRKLGSLLIAPTEAIHDGKEELLTEYLSERTVDELEKLFQDVDEQKAGTNEIIDSTALYELQLSFDNLKMEMKSKSRTAKLWLNYMDYIDIIKMFIRGERTGDWGTHIHASTKMLNIFAATGHIHYAKSTRLYIQLMQELPEKFPWLYQKFVEGNHTIRRTRRLWGGLWSDLVIEQVLMRGLKSRGGLTHGRGLTESVRHQWIHSLHRCVAVHDAMTTLTNLKTKSSEQHVDLGKTRQKRDIDDVNKMFNWFDIHDPFDLSSQALRSISTGLQAQEDDQINCDNAEAVGFEIQLKLNDKLYCDSKIKRSEQVKPLASLSSKVKVGKKTEAYLHPTVLFTRLVAMAQRDDDDVSKYFEYELTTMPTSLFKENFMRKPNKSQLRSFLASEDSVTETPKDGVFILDGGALLHKVRWVQGESFSETLRRYVNYVKKYNGCYIIFDGYDKIGVTKDHEHQRRMMAKKACADIKVSLANPVSSNQADFLSNNFNKSQFVKLLSEFLAVEGNIVTNCEEDADAIIAKKALELSKEYSQVNVIADDTDVFVMLVHHLDEEIGELFFCSDKAGKTWKLQDVASCFDPIIKRHLLFLHAWCGCDTTSAIFGHGKTGFIKKFLKSTELQQLSNVFYDPWATQEEISNAGERMFVAMYGGSVETLGKLR